VLLNKEADRTLSHSTLGYWLIQVLRQNKEGRKQNNKKKSHKTNSNIRKMSSKLFTLMKKYVTK